MGSSVVSIITPTYNHEKFIRQCVESVLAQTYPHWEMIIVDDGSTDNTGKIVIQYSDPRIRYFNQRHKGIKKLDETYNFAFSQAGGELIAILEGDDFWAPHHLETLIPLFKNNATVVLAWSLVRAVTEDGRITEMCLPRNWQNLAYQSSLTVPMLQCIEAQPIPCGVLIKRSALKEIGGFQALRLHNATVVDYSTFLHLSLKGDFACSHKVTAYWRFYSRSISFGYDAMRASEYVEYAQRFFRKHHDKLSLSQKEIRKLYRAWHRIKSEADAKAIIYQGRRALVERRWKDALSFFTKGLRTTKSPLFIGICCLGIAAVLCHKDLETAVKVASKLIGRESWTFREVS